MQEVLNPTHMSVHILSAQMMTRQKKCQLSRIHGPLWINEWPNLFPLELFQAYEMFEDINLV